MRGDTLRARLNQGDRFPVLLDAIIQAGDALAAAHSAGIVHRVGGAGAALLGLQVLSLRLVWRKS